MVQRPDPSPSIPSVTQRILAVMATISVPTWVVRSAEEIQAYSSALHVGLSASSRVQAIAATLSWTLHGGLAPISGTKTEPTERAARIELDAALFVMTEGRAPWPEEWVALGKAHPPRAAVGDSPDWADGVASALGWLIGARATPPTQ